MRIARDKGGRGVKVTTHLGLVSKECCCNATNPFGFVVVHMESVSCWQFCQPHSATTKFTNVPVYWDMMPFSLVHTYRNFGQSCHLNPQVEAKLAVSTHFYFRNTSTYLPHSMAHVFIRRKFIVAALVSSHLTKCMTACSSVRALINDLYYKKQKNKIYRTIILPSVMYGCETWSLTLREKHRLGVLINRALRKICGPMREELI
jgi:hypothetical protein